MKNFQKILTTLLLLVAFTSCGPKKTPTGTDGLLPATQTGANTFACFVGTDVANTGIPYSQWSSHGAGYSLGTNTIDTILTIKAITLNPRRDFYFSIKLTNGILGIHDANRYVISGYSDLNIEGGTAPGSNSYFETIDSLPATITITKFNGNIKKGSQDGDILSGTFDMLMQNSSKQKIHLSSGRFDLAHSY